MIKSVTIINYMNESLTLELMRPEKSGFAVKKIEGLGPVKANIHTAEVSTRDGSSYTSARTTQRNIVIYLKYLFQKSIEDVRQKSYRYFPVKKPISLIIETDNRVLGIDGYVEANEPDIFSNESGAQISIICPDPYFHAAGQAGTTAVTFYGVDPAFEFPFSSESTIEFGSIKNVATQNVPYTGDVETGIVVSMRATSAMTENISMYNMGTRESITVDVSKLEAVTGDRILAGDEITICTVKGYKSATLFRDGRNINILNCLSRDTNWLQLQKGDNIFAYITENNYGSMQVKVSYSALYEGV